VAHICNLVQEFNGLVSKGPVVILALLLFSHHSFFPWFFYLFLLLWQRKKCFHIIIQHTAVLFSRYTTHNSYNNLPQQQVDCFWVIAFSGI
jgi:hypothetical protein